MWHLSFLNNSRTRGTHPQGWVASGPERNGERTVTFPESGTCGNVREIATWALHLLSKAGSSNEELRMLDIGSGVAAFDATISHLHEISTVAIAPRDEHGAQVDMATERGLPILVDALVANNRLRFPAGSFDLVYCCWCRTGTSADPFYAGGKFRTASELFREDQALYLHEVQRLLKPGGLYVMSAAHTPNYDFPAACLLPAGAMFTGGRTSSNDTHWRRYKDFGLPPGGMHAYRSLSDLGSCGSIGTTRLCTEEQQRSRSMQACVTPHRAPAGSQTQIRPPFVNHDQRWKRLLGVQRRPDRVQPAAERERVVILNAHTNHMVGEGRQGETRQKIIDEYNIRAMLSSALRSASATIWGVPTRDAQVMLVGLPGNLSGSAPGGTYLHDWCTEALRAVPRAFDVIMVPNIGKLLQVCARTRSTDSEVAATITRLVLDWYRVLRSGGTLLIADSFANMGLAERELGLANATQALKRLDMVFTGCMQLHLQSVGDIAEPLSQQRSSSGTVVCAVRHQPS